jgi:histone acetyltransferase (RNA polymerase elongator complex component)
MSWYVNKDIERGYSECLECKKCLILHQAGFEVDVHMCSLCGQMVADKEGFFKFQTGMEK